MQVIRSVGEMQSFSIAQRSRGRLLALVPTMGALHEGHASLVRIAVERADCTIVSIFVNPTQFGPNEDFEAYPRPLEADLQLLRELGADVAFCPEPDDIYPAGHSTTVLEDCRSRDLCGISRPNHFRGVTTVCTILFNITRPDFAVFGQKDAQQCAVIRKIVADLHLPVEILVGETVREADGLALSSRNRYLSPDQRADATRFYQALEIGGDLVSHGTLSPDRGIAEIHHSLNQCRRIRVIYASVVERDTLRPVREIEPGRDMVVLACWVDRVRLIDNILL